MKKRTIKFSVPTTSNKHKPSKTLRLKDQCTNSKKKRNLQDQIDKKLIKMIFQSQYKHSTNIINTLEYSTTLITYPVFTPTKISSKNSSVYDFLENNNICTQVKNIYIACVHGSNTLILHVYLDQTYISYMYATVNIRTHVYQEMLMYM